MRLVGEGRVSLAGLVSRTFPLDHIHDAFEHSTSGTGMKAMVTFGPRPTTEK
jgi:Zn-dependent alcohol dehydrogenase